MIMKTILKFNLNINGELIKSINKEGRNVFIQLSGKTQTMSSIKKEHKIILSCYECDNDVQVKSLQLYIKKNKKFLCRKCRSTGVRNGMFGKTFSDETIKKFSENNSGEKNPFFGKKHSIKTRKLQSQKKKGLYNEEKNPMFNRSVLDIWIKKYGYEIAMKMWEKKSIIQSNMMIGEKNPMFNKSILDVWIKKYGYEIAEEKYNEWTKNVSDGLTKFYIDDVEVKARISRKLKGRIFTDEHRKKLRLSTILHLEKRLKLNGGKHVPAFNINACMLFDKIAQILNINILHALNGGEYFIKELGYWVDGYDIKNNIVYEYYEKFHKYKIKRDTRRENEIKEFLNCKLRIIREGDEDNFINNLTK